MYLLLHRYDSYHIREIMSSDVAQMQRHNQVHYHRQNCTNGPTIRGLARFRGHVPTATDSE